MCVCVCMCIYIYTYVQHMLSLCAPVCLQPSRRVDRGAPSVTGQPGPPSGILPRNCVFVGRR